MRNSIRIVGMQHSDCNDTQVLVKIEKMFKRVTAE